MNTGEPRTIEWLIRELDADSDERAEDAQAVLTSQGRHTDVVPPLLRALPTLGSFGQLCAIEILKELDDRRADQSLLDSENSTVRQWAAEALGRLRVYDAVPALRRAYQASLSRRDPLDSVASVVLRHALTDLGARQPIVPRLTADLQGARGAGFPAWPSTRLIDVIGDLANHRQVTLYFQLWSVEPDGRTRRVDYPRDNTMLDFAQPWPFLVVQARNRAVNGARHAELREDIVASIEWIGERDLAIDPDGSVDGTEST
ncbi:HEAT repeat domain-containing protein [Amycolatopsis pigmentata]|uniref:HEAT repeat domain-containing protein n=1 Tax=Amycolatopsis pigmentata TaxID=450801 RepID=A0ABW5FYZ5_9PSEU